MKRLICSVVIGMLMLGSVAMAAVAPTGGCGDFGCPPGATGRFTVEDMGSFNGNVWTWYEDFAAAYGNQLSNANPAWETTFAPYIQDGVTYIPIFWGAGCRAETGETMDCNDPNVTQYDMMMACDVCGSGADTMQFEALNPPALALTYTIDQDLYVNNFFDDRTYDESHPDFGMQAHVGGWHVGISVLKPELAANISRVEIVGTGGGHSEYTTIVTKPDVYDWIGQTFYDYVIFMGTKALVCDQYDISIYDQNGALITYIFDGDPNQFVHSVITVIPGKGNLAPSICKIKKMAIKKNGEIKMKFTAPAHPDADHIRVRLFDENGNGIYSQKIFPPFEIVRKNGDVIADIVKVFIPAEHIGRTGRIEFRTKGANPYGGEGSYMLRGITYFQLP